MLKRVLWVLYAAGILLVVCIQVAAAYVTGTVPEISGTISVFGQAVEETGGSAGLSLADSGNPKTGDHPAPIWSAMGLVFSGVVLVMLADERHRKK